jgi:hypothetical protein
MFGMMNPLPGHHFVALNHVMAIRNPLQLASLKFPMKSKLYICSHHTSGCSLCDYHDSGLVAVIIALLVRFFVPLLVVILRIVQFIELNIALLTFMTYSHITLSSSSFVLASCLFPFSKYEFSGCSIAFTDIGLTTPAPYAALGHAVRPNMVMSCNIGSAPLALTARKRKRGSDNINDAETTRRQRSAPAATPRGATKGSYGTKGKDGLGTAGPRPRRSNKRRLVGRSGLTTNTNTTDADNSRQSSDDDGVSDEDEVHDDTLVTKK